MNYQAEQIERQQKKIERLSYSAAYFRGSVGEAIDLLKCGANPDKVLTLLENDVDAFEAKAEAAGYPKA